MDGGRGCIAVILLEDQQHEDDESFTISAAGFENVARVMILNDDGMDNSAACTDGYWHNNGFS